MEWCVFDALPSWNGLHIYKLVTELQSVSIEHRSLPSAFWNRPKGS
jgi:hypothetical protein